MGSVMSEPHSSFAGGDNGNMNKRWRLLLIVCLWSVISTAALAHDVLMSAMVSFSPPALRSGTVARIQVQVLDAYRSPIRRAGVQARFWSDGGPQGAQVKLTETAPGRYEGGVQVPREGTAIIRVEATLPDGLWAGQLPLSVGPDEPPATEIAIELLHQDALTGAPPGDPGNGLFYLGAVLLTALILGVRSYRLIQTRLIAGGGGGVTGLKLRYLQMLAIGLPAVTVALFEYLRHRWLEPKLPPGMGNIVGGVIVATGVYGFVHIFARLIRRASDEAMRSRERTVVVLERQRIAREMHDGVAQMLFFLSVKLKDVHALVGEGRTGEAQAQLSTMGNHLEEAYGQVRAVIVDLKQQAELQEFGDAVRRVALETGARLGLRVSAEIAGAPRVASAAQQHLLAIVQEALTNAQRHGEARRAVVRLQDQGAGFLLEVEDDGKGFDRSTAPEPGKFGLEIMAERARMVGGELEVESASGKGTRITVRIREGIE